MKTLNESFDDIVFENRNKEYGAYDLRLKYSKRGSLAMVIALILVLFAVGGPLLANILNNKPIERDIAIETEIELENLEMNDEKIELPEPEPPEVKVDDIKFVAPRVVDEISEPQLELLTFGEYALNPNSNEIDTGSIIVIKPGDKSEIVPVEKIYETPDIHEVPMFPGGESELIKFIALNTIYPVEAIEKGIEGTVYLRFVVTKSGRIGQVNPIRSPDPILEVEAVRVIKSLPEWTPGKFNGNPVNVWFIIPVKFKLQ